MLRSRWIWRRTLLGLIAIASPSVVKLLMMLVKKHSSPKWGKSAASSALRRVRKLWPKFHDNWITSRTSQVRRVNNGDEGERISWRICETQELHESRNCVVASGGGEWGASFSTSFTRIVRRVGAKCEIFSRATCYITTDFSRQRRSFLSYELPFNTLLLVTRDATWPLGRLQLCPFYHDCIWPFKVIFRQYWSNFHSILHFRFSDFISVSTQGKMLFVPSIMF